MHEPQPFQPGNGAIPFGGGKELIPNGGGVHRGGGVVWIDSSRSAGGSTPLHLANVGGVNLSELGGDDRCRDTHRVHHRGALIPGAAIVTVGDPYGLAIGEAGSRGEAHGRFRLVLDYPTASGRASLPPLVPGQRPSRYSPTIRPSCRTWAYPYSSERERHRSQARSSSVVSFSQGAEGQITERRFIRSVSFGSYVSYSIGGGIPAPPCAT